MFEQEFTLYPQCIVHDFESILTLLNEHVKRDVTCFPRHKPVSVNVHDTLSKEPVYLVNENPQLSIERSIKALTEKEQAIVADIFKLFQGKCNSSIKNGNNNLNVRLQYFLKEITLKESCDCNENVFVGKENNIYIFLTISKFKYLDMKSYIGSGLRYDV